MKTIRLMLEYNTYCLWLYDEKGELIDNDNPEEWAEDEELTKAFMEISDLYDSFFIDDGREFRYVGCPNDETRIKLTNMINKAVKLLEGKNRGKYIIVNDIKFDF